MRLPAPLARVLSGRYRRTPELRILALGVVLAVASLSSVGFFTDRVQRAMSEQATELLGADLVIVSSDAPRTTVRQSARAAGLQVAETVSFGSVALYQDKTLLTQVKAVSDDLVAHFEHDKTLFPDGSDKGDVETWAKAEIWSDKDAFMKRFDDAIADAKALGEVTDLAALGPTLGKLGKEACGGCHDKYRRPKN